MKTPSNNWGYPGKNASKKQLKKYSNRIKKIGDDNQKNIDLVLIDGRFRVACCLKAYQVIPEDCKIVFDDFLTRDHYNIVLQFYNIIDKTEDNRMVILEKNKSKQNIPISLIKKYELIPS